jgi:hypothetical protein
MASQLPAKFFKALVSGVIKMTLLADTTVTDAMLTDEIFAPNNVSEADAAALTAAISAAVQDAARANSSVAELEKALTRQGSFEGELKDAFLSAWKSEGPKVHARNVAASDRNTPALLKCAWRVDLTTQSRSRSELNEASAIIQVTAGGDATVASSASAAASSSDTFQFEMNRGELGALLATVNEINDAIQKRAGATKTE